VGQGRRKGRGSLKLELKFRALSARSHGGRMCEISDAGSTNLLEIRLVWFYYINSQLKSVPANQSFFHQHDFLCTCIT